MDRQKKHREKKQKALKLIDKKFHDHNGADGYRKIKVYIEREGIVISNPTAHKYMNGELGLYSVTRQKKPNYKKGKKDKICGNKLNQNFDVRVKNRFWCTDITYIYTKKEGFVYYCVVIDLCGRCVVGAAMGREITSELAIRALAMALERNPDARGKVMVHTDQGVQFTCKAYWDFCNENGIERSMSHAGYPYDNAVVERFFNTLKYEYIYLFDYEDFDAVSEAAEKFTFTIYNHERPMSVYDNLTPFEAREKLDQMSKMDVGNCTEVPIKSDQAKPENETQPGAVVERPYAVPPASAEWDNVAAPTTARNQTTHFPLFKSWDPQCI